MGRAGLAANGYCCLENGKNTTPDVTGSVDRTLPLPAPPPADPRFRLFDRTLGRLLFLLSVSTDFADNPDDLYRQQRIASVIRAMVSGGIVLAAAMLPAFYDELPAVMAYAGASVIGAALVFLRIQPRAIVMLMGVFDTAIITYCVHLTGSLTTVVVVLYPMLVILGTLFAGIWTGLFYAFMTTWAYAGIIIAEGLGVIPYSPLMGHEYPYLHAAGIPTYPIVVITVAHLVNFGGVMMAGLVVYALEKRRRLAQEAFRSRTELAAICSHDLKNLLAGVAGHTELAEMRVATGDMAGVRGSLKSIRESGDRMMELVRDLLDLARLEAGQIVLSRSRFSIVRTVQGSVHSLKSAAQFRKIDLQVELPPEDIEVTGDQSKVIQILTNLVQNAITYTPEGGTVRVTVETPGSGWVRISVLDSGPGISPEDALTLFDTDALLRRRKGAGRSSLSTGLGLNIVRRLSELHGGRVWADTNRASGEGAGFYVELPAE